MSKLHQPKLSAFDNDRITAACAAICPDNPVHGLEVLLELAVQAVPLASSILHRHEIITEGGSINTDLSTFSERLRIALKAIR